MNREIGEMGATIKSMAQNQQTYIDNLEKQESRISFLEDSRIRDRGFMAGIGCVVSAIVGCLFKVWP